jgi:hypothetical protein
MADDPNPSLRAELAAALVVIEPEINGFEGVLKWPSISPETASVILDIIDIRVRRRDLIKAVIVALDAVVDALIALEADGYPRLGSIPVAAAVKEEIQQDERDLEAAVGALSVAHAETGDFNPERSTNT